jgi:hypothetical protein
MKTTIQNGKIRVEVISTNFPISDTIPASSEDPIAGVELA